MSTGHALEKRIGIAMCELALIRKELILTKMKAGVGRRKPMQQWEALARDVSSAWDSVTVMEEITSQREKSW